MYRILGKICYGLAGASIVLALGTQFKLLQGGARPAHWWQRSGERDAHSERQSLFFGLWAPTFAIFGKVLDDMGTPSQGAKHASVSSGEDPFTSPTAASDGRTQGSLIGTRSS